MPKPQNPDRKNTTIGISKITKGRLRLYAESAGKRKGFESDAQILDRIIDQYISEHPPKNNIPQPTYVSS